jgi:hypothetical protein
MADSERIHGLLSQLKDLASELGRAPKRDEFAARHGEQFRKSFGTFSTFLLAAGLKGRELAKEHKAEKFKYQKIQVDGFALNIFDLDRLFEDAGNPEILKVLGMSDTHVEHRDEDAVDVYLQFAKLYDPHIHLIGGDFVDAEGISHWPPHDFKPRDFGREIIEARELLKQIVRSTPNASNRIYLTGNHEDWIRQAMLAEMPGFFDALRRLELVPDLKVLLDLDKFKYTLIPLNEVVRMGRLHVIHGWYTGNSHPKKHLDTFMADVSYFHLHDKQSTHKTSVYGKVEANSNGCLCKKNPHYTKGMPTNWAQGFPIWEIKRSGEYRRIFIDINEGEIFYNGKLLKSRFVGAS